MIVRVWAQIEVEPAEVTSGGEMVGSARKLGPGDSSGVLIGVGSMDVSGEPNGENRSRAGRMSWDTTTPSASSWSSRYPVSMAHLRCSAKSKVVLISIGRPNSMGDAGKFIGASVRGHEDGDIRTR